MRNAYALSGALLLGGATAALALQPASAGQTAQNDPGQIAGAVPRAGAPSSFADLVAKLQPAVVNISTTQKVTVPQQQANPFAGTPFGDLFGQQFGQGSGGGAPITREAQSLGSGFIISADGYVVTNNHVIAAGTRGATVESITVTLQDRKEYTAKLIGRDPTSDLALLKIDAAGLPFVRLGDSTRARVGDWVVAIGQPFGLGGTVTAGIVSAVHRSTGQAGPFDTFIQTDAAINQGNSGGPMFNMAGDVIGINSQIFSQSGGNIGIGFAIPATEAKPIIDKLRSGQKIQRGYLGVGIRPVDEGIAASLGIPKNQGEIIASVEPGGPAAKAGLREGDVVTAVGGKPVTPDQTLSSLVAGAAPGSAVRFDVIRGGKPSAVTATVGTRPSEDQLAALQGGSGSGDDDGGFGGDDDGTAQAPQSASSALGLTVQPLTPQIARQIGVDSTVQGVVVSAVDASTDAGQKLRRTDVISSVNTVPVRTAADVARQVAAAKAAGRTQVLLQVTRGRQTGALIAVKIK